MNEISPQQVGRANSHLAEAAREIGHRAAARAKQADDGRRLPAETVREMEAAGLCKVWIPKAYGGLEAGLQTGLDTMFEMARGCAASSWCLTVWQQHSWIVAMYPEQAQAETLGAEKDFHIAGVLAPRGTVRRTEGGFILNGFWPFASGCDHGTWILLGAMVVDDDGAPVPCDRAPLGVPAMNSRLCLVPIDDVAVLGDWNAAGLAATGSHSIKVDNVFVPEHRALFLPDAVDGGAPGRTVNPDPLFQCTYYSFLHTALCGPAPGVAQGALDHWLGALEGKSLQPMNKPQIELARTHRQIGEIESKIHAARLLLADSARRIEDAALTGEYLDAHERAICRRNGAQAVLLSYEAMERIFFAAGGSHLALTSPIQRAMRDMHAIRAHYFMDIETAYELSGMTRIGRTPYTYVF